MSVSPEKYSYAKPVTLRDEKPDPAAKPIPYFFTPVERDHLQIARIDLERHKRDVERSGVEVGEATWEEFVEARRAFGRHSNV